MTDSKNNKTKDMIEAAAGVGVGTAAGAGVSAAVGGMGLAVAGTAVGKRYAPLRERHGSGGGCGSCCRAAPGPIFPEQYPPDAPEAPTIRSCKPSPFTSPALLTLVPERSLLRMPLIAKPPIPAVTLFKSTRLLSFLPKTT